MSMERTVWTSDHDFTLDGVVYTSMQKAAGHADMLILKDRGIVSLYEDLIASTSPRTILELGIFRGGGAALLSQLATPDKLVALDMMAEPCDPLERFIDQRGLRGTVVPYYGIDQANVHQLDEIVAAEFDGPIDLIIDDASHLVEQTRASFNRLFPHVRPGGLYVIEDWAWAHIAGATEDRNYQSVSPLSLFVWELVLASARLPQSVVDVSVGYHWAVVRRGTANLRPEKFDVSTHFDPVGQQMVDALKTVQSLAT